MTINKLNNKIIIITKKVKLHNFNKTIVTCKDKKTNNLSNSQKNKKINSKFTLDADHLIKKSLHS